MLSTTIAAGIGVVLAVVIVWLLWSGRLREKYVALWLILGLAILVLVVWPGLLLRVTEWLGFKYMSNMLFFVAIFLLLGVCLHLSLEASTLEEETRRLSEEVALLNHRVDQVVEAAAQGPYVPRDGLPSSGAPVTGAMAVPEGPPATVAEAAHEHPTR